LNYKGVINQPLPIRKFDLWKLGIVIGLSTLARPLVLIFLPFLFFAFFMRQRQNWIKRSALVTVAVIVLLIPVGIRNLIVGEEFTLTTSSAGMNFYLGNNSDATGLYWEAPFLSSVEPWYEDEDYRRTASKAAGRNLTTREAGRYWMRQSFDWMINHPGQYISLLGRKAFYFWSRAEFANNVSIYMGKEASPLLRFNPFGFWLIGPIGLAGLILLWKRYKWRKVQLLWLWLLAYFVGALLFFVASEYRLPMLLVLHVGAGFFIVELIERIRSGKIEAIMRVAVLGLLFMPIVNFGTDFIRSGENARMDYFNYGNTLLKQERYDEAIERFEKAIEIDPYFAEGLLKLADANYRAGKIEEAVEIGKRVKLDNPESILNIIRGDAMREAYALLEEGKYGKAMDEFTAAGLDPAEAIAETTRVSRMKRAQIAYREGRLAETLKLFKQIHADDKTTDPSILYNIGFLHWQTGNIDSAEVYTTEALTIDSMNVPSAYLLARIYNATKRRAEARELIERVTPDNENNQRILEEVRVEMDSLSALGKWEEALEAYARYGKLGFDIELEDKYRIGKAQIEVGNYELALRLLTEAESEFQFDAELFYRQGRALQRLDRSSEAVETFQKAISIDPQFVPPRIALARQYIALGKSKNAWKELDAVGHMEILDKKVAREYEALLDSVKGM